MNSFQLIPSEGDLGGPIQAMDSTPNKTQFSLLPRFAQWNNRLDYISSRVGFIWCNPGAQLELSDQCFLTDLVCVSSWVKWSRSSDHHHSFQRVSSNEKWLQSFIDKRGLDWARVTSTQNFIMPCYYHVSSRKTWRQRIPPPPTKSRRKRLSA